MVSRKTCFAFLCLWVLDTALQILSIFTSAFTSLVLWLRENCADSYKQIGVYLATKQWHCKRKYTRKESPGSNQTEASVVGIESLGWYL